MNPTFLECENQVTAKFYDQCAYKGHWLQRYWVDLHFTFREGEISRIENHYDTLTLHQDVLAVRQKLGEYQGWFPDSANPGGDCIRSAGVRLQEMALSARLHTPHINSE